MMNYIDCYGVFYLFFVLEVEVQVCVDDCGYVFYFWSVQVLIDLLFVVVGEGLIFWDYQGNVYFDFFSQLVNLNFGYQYLDLVVVIQQQVGCFVMIQLFIVNDVCGEFVWLIVEVVLEGFEKVFFINGGVEVNEYVVCMVCQFIG